MHKNAYNPKVLNGNWCENRFTDKYDQDTNETTNTHLANASHTKYVPTSAAVGNQDSYVKVSFCGDLISVYRKTSVPQPRTLSTSRRPSPPITLTRPLRRSHTALSMSALRNSGLARTSWPRTRPRSTNTAKSGPTATITSQGATLAPNPSSSQLKLERFHKFINK